MTTETTATATPPSTDPAPDSSVAASTTTTTASEPSVEDRLFEEYSTQSNKRLDSGGNVADIAVPDDDDEGGDPPAKTDKPDTETPAQAGVSTSTPEKTEAADTAATDDKGASSTAAKPEEPNDDEILSSVPEAHREKVKGRLAQARAAAERTATLENEKKDLAQKFRSAQGRIAALTEQQAKGAAKPAAQTEADSAKTKAEFDVFEKKYPEIAKGIKAAFTLQGGDVSNSKDLLEYVAKQRNAAVLSDAYGLVEDVHKGWQTEVKTPAFKEWIKAQPPKVQAWIDGDAEDAILLMDRFKANPTYKPATDAAAADTTAEDTAKKAAAEEAARLAAKRDLQKDGAKTATAKGGGAPDTSVDPNSEDAIFKFYANKANSRLAKSGVL